MQKAWQNSRIGVTDGIPKLPDDNLQE